MARKSLEYRVKYLEDNPSPFSGDLDDIPDGTTYKRISAAKKTVLDNTTNTNTGDETTATIKTKLGITTLSGSNTGDETGTTIKTKLGITTLSGSNTGDQTSIVGISGTKAEFDAACSDGNFLYVGDVSSGLTQQQIEGLI